MGCLVSPLTSYAYVMGLAVDTSAQQYASIRSALAAPAPVQALLPGVAEAQLPADPCVRV